MPKLHMFYLGGNAGRSNIEVHDIQFAVCDDYREAVPALKAAWFGDADKIHIDGWQIVEWADGYDVCVSEEEEHTAMPSEHAPRLYFANVGGYRAGQLAEAHVFGLFAAATPAEAKQKALQTLLPDSYMQRHKDNLKDVDNLLALDRIGKHVIRLVPNPHGKPAEIGFQGYLPI